MTSRPYPAVAAGGAAVQHKETMMEDAALVARLRDLGDRASYEPHIHHVAADRIEAQAADLAEARAQVAALRSELGWYGEQARLCRLIHKEGDAGRHALDNDGGKRAQAALSALSATADAAKRHDAEVRRKALEEAAQIADRQINLGEAVKAIRALIDKEPGHE